MDLHLVENAIDKRSNRERTDAEPLSDGLLRFDALDEQGDNVELTRTKFECLLESKPFLIGQNHGRPTYPSYRKNRP